MALRVWMDIADSFVAVPAVAVVDGLARGRQLADFGLSGVYVAPNSLGMTLLPQNFLPSWPAAPSKWKLGPDLTPSGGGMYEALEHRAAGDWFVASQGPADGAPLRTAATVRRNGGLFLEFFCYAPAHTRVPDVAVLNFGLYYTLHVHSDGTADLADGRPGATAPYLIRGAPLTAGGQDLAGRFIAVAVLPWRRGRVLVVSSQGGWFEAYVGDTLDATGDPALWTSGEAGYHATTAAAQAAVAFTPKTRCLGALNPLRWPLAGALTSPPVGLPYTATQPPATQALQAEAQDRTRAGLALIALNPDGSSAGDLGAAAASGGADALQYQVQMTAPDAGAGYALVTPQVFGVQVEFDRQLGQRTYGTGVIAAVQSARIELSRERGQKSFSFTLDNPDDRWTSLKDLWNRAMYAEFTADGVDAVQRVIFAGQTDPPEFVDGSASKITVPCVGRRKRLRSHLLTDSRTYDGVPHAQSVYQVLRDAGVADADIVVVDDGVPLDSAEPGEDPLWRPANGTSAEDWCVHIAETFSGWVFDDINGTFYYVPSSYFTDAVLATVGVPEILLVTPTDFATGLPTPQASRPNAQVLVALQGGPRQTGQEPRANDLWVLGRDPNTGDVLGAHYEDDGSIADRTAANYVGERRIFIYASASITTTFMAQRALGAIAGRLTQPVRRVSFSLPDYQQDLPLEGPVFIHGYGLALVSDVSAEWSSDRYRLTQYTAELIEPGQ